MPVYKEPCRHCGELLDQDSRFCPKCGSRSPFVDLCPSCLREISRGDKLCAGCGRALIVSCPHCNQETFVGDTCDHCGKTLLKQCKNKRCNEMQFFQNQKCTACGKKLD